MPLLSMYRKNICCQKIFDNSFSFQATEMVLTSKWGRIQPQIQIWSVHCVAASKTGVERCSFSWDQLWPPRRPQCTGVWCPGAWHRSVITTSRCWAGPASHLRLGGCLTSDSSSSWVNEWRLIRLLEIYFSFNSNWELMAMKRWRSNIWMRVFRQ